MLVVYVELWQAMISDSVGPGRHRNDSQRIRAPSQSRTPRGQAVRIGDRNKAAGTRENVPLSRVSVHLKVEVSPLYQYIDIHHPDSPR